MTCPQCGTHSSEDARFCSVCGRLLTDESGDTTTMIPVVEERPSTLSVQEQEAVAALAPGHALLIVKRGPGESHRFLIDADVTTVGRHPESDIFLDDITVSRHHAKFVRATGRLYLEDLGSLNGTYVNRTLLDGRAQLRDGDEIQVGKYRATILLGE